MELVLWSQPCKHHSLWLCWRSARALFPMCVCVCGCACVCVRVDLHAHVHWCVILALLGQLAAWLNCKQSIFPTGDREDCPTREVGQMMYVCLHFTYIYVCVFMHIGKHCSVGQTDSFLYLNERLVSHLRRENRPTCELGQILGVFVWRCKTHTHCCTFTVWVQPGSDSR